MLTVVVDTTTTFPDVMMKRTTWMQLLTLSADGVVDLVMPRVVLDETARHWAEQANEALEIATDRVGKVSKSQKSLDYYELGESIAPIPLAPVAIADPAAFLEKALDKLLPLGVSIAEVPDHVDIAMVLARDLARKKPFDTSGKGFRDTLVWETLRDLALASKTGQDLIFVSDNSTDFCEGGELAPELLVEVAEMAGTLSRVANLDELLAIPALEAAVASLAKTDEELANWLAIAGDEDPEIEPPTITELVTSAMVSAVETLVDDEVSTEHSGSSGHDFSGLGVPAELDEIAIAWVDPEENSVVWQTYETYDETTLLIRGEIDATVSLQGLVFKSDYYSLDEALDEHIELVDWDVSPHYAQVVVNVAATLVFQIRVEQGQDYVEECEFEGVEVPTSPDEGFIPHG